MPKRVQKHAGLWDNISLDGEHWIWNGSVSDGRCCYYNPATRRTVKVHVEVWRRIFGQPPGNLTRICPRGRCVNPSHHALMDCNIERYIAKEKGGCWIWLGRMINGRPVWSSLIRGGDVVHQKSHSVVRIIWGRAGRRLEYGQRLVRGVCRNLRCVNPDHCRVASGEEVGDFAGQSPRRLAHLGEDHFFAKLSDARVARMRSLFATGDYTKADLSRRFGISQTQGCDILNGKKRKTR